MQTKIILCVFLNVEMYSKMFIQHIEVVYILEKKRTVMWITKIR